MLFDVIMISPQGPIGQRENFGNWEFWGYKSLYAPVVEKCNADHLPPLSTPLTVHANSVGLTLRNRDALEENERLISVQHVALEFHWCASGCVVECRVCNREVAGSNLDLGYFAPRSTQPSILRGR